MGASKTSTDTSQHSTQQPWAPAVPALQQVLGDASNFYNTGVGTSVYSGNRVAQLGDDSLTGLQMARDQASSDNAGAIGTSYLQGVLGSGGGVSYNGPSLNGDGLSSGTVGALSNLAGVKGVDTSKLSTLADSLGDPNSAVNKTATSFMNGSRDLTTQPMLEGLLSRALAPSSAETNLSDVAAGKYLDPTTNPYLQAAITASNQNVGNAQKEAFAASGRYGSGNFAAATAKAINDTDTALYANQYNTERQNQLSANSQIDTARQNGTQLGAGIVNQISGVQSTNNQQRLAGAGVQQAQTAQQAGVLGQVLGGDEFNANLDYNKAAQALGTYRQGTSDAMSNEQNRVSTALQSQGQALQATSMLPSIDALRYSPSQTLLGVGGVLQNQDQSNINAAEQQFDETNQMPWTALNRFAGIAGGIGGMGSEGTSVGHTTQTQQQSLGSTLLGSVTGIGGMAANLGKSGLLGQAGKMGADGVLSGATGVLGFLGLSDARAKENLEEVGRLHDGQPVYRFNYRGDPRTQIGLVAQEVARAVPDAVGPMPGTSGLLGVDYRRATDRSAALARAA